MGNPIAESSQDFNYFSNNKIKNIVPVPVA